MPGPGILSTILDTTGERLRERLKMDQDFRSMQTKSLVDAIHAIDENGNPKLSPEQMDQAWEEIASLNKSKTAKDVIAKARDIVGKIHGMGNKPNPALLQRAGQQTSDALAGGQGGGLVQGQPQPTPAQAPTPGQAQAQPSTLDTEGMPLPYTPPPPQQRQPVQRVAAAASQTPPPPPARTSMSQIVATGSPGGQKIAEESAKQKAISGRMADAANREGEDRHALGLKIGLKDGTAAMAQFVAGHGQVFPTALMKPNRIGSYTDKDNKQVEIMQRFNSDSGDWDVYEVDSKGTVRPMRGTLSGAAIDATAAKRRGAAGEQFLFPDGTPIDVSTLQPDEELRAWQGDPSLQGKYGIFNQTYKTITANNLVREHPALNPNVQTVQGVARTGTTGTHEEQAVDANGNPIAMPLKSTTTPNTGPGPGQTAPGPGPAQAGPAPSPIQAPSPAPPTTPAAPPSPGGARPLPGFNRAERQNQLQVARPVRAAGVQLFGSPDNPDIESLESFAKLADNAGSRQRVGTAARMIINNLSAADANGGGVGASILGQAVSVNGGDLWTALKNYSGLTQLVSSSQVAATENALKALSPEESRMLNQIIAAYGTVVGLRTLTRGGAYKFSVASMERELPIPGLSDVKDSLTYYNKLAKLANEVVEGTKGISDQVLPEKKFYIEQARRLNLLGQGKNPNTSPTPPPGRSSAQTTQHPDTGETYYKVPGGWSRTPPK